ncbi:MAG: glycosyltransferase family protein [Candidatus Komeilibacteria bacterium]
MVGKNQEKVDIIMFNMSSAYEWHDGVHNRNYHILQTLRDDPRINRIISIDYAPWTWTKMIKQFWFGYLDWSNKAPVLYRSVFTKARQLSTDWINISSVMPYFHEDRFWSELNKIINNLEIGDDAIIWSYNPLLSNYLSAVKGRAYIFEAVDDWRLHPSYQTITKLLDGHYRRIAEKSDFIFTVADELTAIFNQPSKTFWLPNAVDWQHYQQKFSLLDRAISDLPRPIIGYMGIILGRLDSDIITYLAEHNPTKSIALVGSYRGKTHYWDKALIEKLKKYNNIHLLGFVPYDKTPMYIQQFNVAIIPHRVDGYVSTTNPMKMYEYLACGRPVVATPAPGIDMFSSIRVASNPADFNQAVIKELAEDNEEKQEMRRQSVRQHTWQARVDKMLSFILD